MKYKWLPYRELLAGISSDVKYQRLMWIVRQILRRNSINLLPGTVVIPLRANDRQARWLPQLPHHVVHSWQQHMQRGLWQNIFFRTANTVKYYTAILTHVMLCLSSGLLLLFFCWWIRLVSFILWKCVIFTLTRRVAMPSLKAAHWVGPIFRRLWTTVYQIKFACAGMSIVCNAVFWLTMSCCVPEIFTKSCEIAPKFWCFWAAKFRGMGPPKFVTKFL